MGLASRSPTYPTIPHMTSAPPPRPCRSSARPGAALPGPWLRAHRGLDLDRFAGTVLARTTPRRPPLEVTLRRATHGERPGWHVVGDGGPGADVGVVADRDRRHQLRVAPDLHPPADHRALLPAAVALAGEG